MFTSDFYSGGIFLLLKEIDNFVTTPNVIIFGAIAVINPYVVDTCWR